MIALAALALLLTACPEDEPGVGDEPADPDAADEEAPDDAEAAEEFDWEPEQDVTMVVPFAAGGGSDLLGRAVAAGIEDVRPDVNVSVENREGGSGAVGYGYFLEQTGNPHFLLPAEVMLSMLPSLQEVPFDYDTWTHVGMFAEDVGFFVVNADSEWETIEEFMEDAEEAAAEGRPFRVGLPAAGGVDEVTVYQLAQEAGVEFEHVIYDGTGETNPALMGGDIEATVVNPSDGRDELEGELFRALVGFSEEPFEDPLLEDVPMAPEFGWEVTATKYRGAILPPDVPQEAVDYWIAALQEWTETEGYEQYMEDALLAENHQWGEDWITFIEEWNQDVLPVLDEMGS